MFSRALTALAAIACAVAACSGDTASSNSGDAAAGTGGNAGSAGSAGRGGSAGSAGRGGSAGNAGRGGSAGNSGSGGSAGGSGGASGSAGSGGAGTGGVSGSAGNAGSGGSAGSVSDASTSCPEGGTPDASVEDAIRTACTIAVVRVSRLDEECSGLGGTHVTFTVIAVGRGTPVTVLSHGGHGYFATPAGPDAVGEYFVAGVDAFGRLIPRPDNGAWCITGLPDIDGQVHTLLAATSEADARTKMRGLL